MHRYNVDVYTRACENEVVEGMGKTREIGPPAQFTIAKFSSVYLTLNLDGTNSTGRTRVRNSTNVKPDRRTKERRRIIRPRFYERYATLDASSPRIYIAKTYFVIPFRTATIRVPAFSSVVNLYVRIVRNEELFGGKLIVGLY